MRVLTGPVSTTFAEKMMKWILVLAFAVCSGCITFKVPDVAHQVQPGETLSMIAERYYGKQNVSEGIKTIVRANPHIGKGPGIQSQLVLRIPELN
jgi:nucleoid-associated protein YgaU